MVFNSPMFLFAFLPLILLVFHLVPAGRGKNAFLIGASLLFYAFGDPADLLLLLFSAVLHYLVGLALLRLRRGRKLLLAAVILANLGLLLTCKLTGRLPLGISFFTFQTMSFVIDLYRDPACGSRSFREVLQYLTFFPQLVSGPLMKFSAARQFMQGRRVTAEETAEGMVRFTVGLAKKLLLSAAAAGVADAVFALPADSLDIRTAWLGAVCYTLQIFFDFSGYSDMALGLGRMFGYSLPENFRYPYAASSVTEFWRRWHISLSAWFRDYLYIPLGGNRKGKGRTVFNKLVVFLATGLWHGLSGTFVLWGLWHGLWSAVETVFRLPQKLKGKWYGHAYAMLVVLLSFVLFRAENVGQAMEIIAAMFTGFSLTAAGTTLLSHQLGMRTIVFLVVACVLCLPVGPWLQQRLSGWKGYGAVTKVFAMGLFVVCVLALASSSFQPFIYVQF